MDNFEERKYLVIPSSLLNNIDINEIHEPCSDCVLKSIDNQYAIVSYIDRPSFYNESYEEFSYPEILEYSKGENWGQ
jgi:hypothetical protein